MVITRTWHLSDFYPRPREVRHAFFGYVVFACEMICDDLLIKLIRRDVPGSAAFCVRLDVGIPGPPASGDRRVVWQVNSEDGLASTQFPHHLDFVLDQLEAVSDLITQIQDMDKGAMSLQVVHRRDAGDNTPWLSPEQLARIAHLRLEFGISIYSESNAIYSSRLRGRSAAM